MTSAPVPLPSRMAAEFSGNSFLSAVVTGPGTATQRLLPPDTGLPGSRWDAVVAGALSWTRQLRQEAATGR